MYIYGSACKYIPVCIETLCTCVRTEQESREIRRAIKNVVLTCKSPERHRPVRLSMVPFVYLYTFIVQLFDGNGLASRQRASQLTKTWDVLLLSWGLRMDSGVSHRSGTPGVDRRQGWLRGTGIFLSFSESIPHPGDTIQTATPSPEKNLARSDVFPQCRSRV